MVSAKLIEISNKALIKLGLVDTTVLESVFPNDVALAIGCVAQLVERADRGDSRNDSFKLNRLVPAIEKLRKYADKEGEEGLPGCECDTKEEGEVWKKALLNWPPLAALMQGIQQKKAKGFAQAPDLLKYWFEACKASDLESLVNAEDGLTTDLASLKKGVDIPADWGEVFVCFCKEKNGKDGAKKEEYDPVVGAYFVSHPEHGLVHKPDTELSINRSHFFDESDQSTVDIASGELADFEMWKSVQWLSTKNSPQALSLSDPEAKENDSGNDLGDVTSEVFDEESVGESSDPSVSPGSEVSIHEFFELWSIETARVFGADDGLRGLSTIIQGGYARPLVIRLVDSSDPKVSNHSKAIEEAIVGAKDYPLIHNVANWLVKPVDKSELSLVGFDRESFVGHMDTFEGGQRKPAFPLDLTQRMAAMVVSSQAFVDPKAGALIPVSGPPGTGKTSFLRAALASIWVRAALEGAAHPKIVYGTAATNQAVSNMIEAFGGIKGEGERGPGSPWIDGLSSYGWFYPAQKAALERPDLMHLAKSPFVGGSKQQKFAAAGQASNFADRCANDLDGIETELLDRAWTTFQADSELCKDLFIGKKVTFEQVNLQWVLDTARHKLQSLHDRLVYLLRSNKSNVQFAVSALRIARKSAWKLLCLSQELKQIKHDIEQYEKLASDLQALFICAKEYALLSGQFQTKNERWLRKILPGKLYKYVYRDQLAKLNGVENAVSQALRATGLPQDLLWLSGEQLVAEIKSRLQKCKEALGELIPKVKNFEIETEDLYVARANRKARVEQLLSCVTKPEQRCFLLRSARRLSVFEKSDSTDETNSVVDSVYESVTHLFESDLDVGLRTEMFHWAARYWECAWVMASKEDLEKKNIPPSRELEKAMMLGLIVVATTHKVLDLGRERKADLLIMDEAGQCQAEIGAACLTLAHNAAFIGDDLQLRPVTSLSSSFEKNIRQKVCASLQVPVEASATEGSAMKIGLAVAHQQFRGLPGVTLLYHYRCTPAIIGYCNELLYEGRIINARVAPRKANLTWMPEISWVDVQGEPKRSGSSWINEAEANSICDWIEANFKRLTTVNNKDGSLISLPLKDVVAVVTPLRPQAIEITKRLKSRLGEEAIEGMVIGTVHKLQGAERPVVLFSLVQNKNTNRSLMADRDGGMLMNVAVSRAKDAFVLFAQRESVLPAPMDEQLDKSKEKTPIAVLGRYMRRNGQRLFPSSLLVIEAPNKEYAVAQALGLDAKVIATEGTLRHSRLTEDGLIWTNSPQGWLDKLSREIGLVKEVVIATDDDLAGEMIGLHAAQDVHDLAARLKIPAHLMPIIRRMRFHSTEQEELRQAYELAGEKFDSNLLAAALFRQYTYLLDKKEYSRVMGAGSYVSAQSRDLLEKMSKVLDSKLDADGKPLKKVELTLKDRSGKPVQAFVAESSSKLALPRAMEESQAREMAMALKQANDCGDQISPFEYVGDLGAVQIPGPYPASTTARILALGRDELGLEIDTAQDNLNALYSVGARPAIVDRFDDSGANDDRPYLDQESEA